MMRKLRSISSKMIWIFRIKLIFKQMQCYKISVYLRLSTNTWYLGNSNYDFQYQSHIYWWDFIPHVFILFILCVNLETGHMVISKCCWLQWYSSSVHLSCCWRRCRAIWGLFQKILSRSLSLSKKSVQLPFRWPAPIVSISFILCNSSFTFFFLIFFHHYLATF